MLRPLVRSGSFFAIRKTNRLRNRVAMMFEPECTLVYTLDARVVFFFPGIDQGRGLTDISDNAV